MLYTLPVSAHAHVYVCLGMPVTAVPIVPALVTPISNTAPEPEVGLERIRGKLKTLKEKENIHTNSKENASKTTRSL